MVNWASILSNITEVGAITATLIKTVPQFRGLDMSFIKSTVILGGFIFIPPPTRVADEIYHKVAEIPILGMKGNRLQYFGYRAPRIYIEGEWIYAEETGTRHTTNPNVVDIVAPEDMKYILRKIIKAYNGKSMPFISMVNPQFRMVMVESELYEPIEGRPNDIRYRLTLIQQLTYGGP